MSAASLKADKRRRPFRWQAAVAAVAGPLLIAAVLVVVLRGMVFGGALPSQNKDILSFFLPNECFLGRALRAGQVPGWNPFAMGGVPFAADPQSGWMYLPTMVLYGLFRCDAAMRLLLVVHPLLAGLGVYWFLRAERASRPAATTAGLVLSLVIAGSKIATNVPFGGVLAWSALLLAAAACYFRASTWSARLGWAALAGVFWSQLAASHLSNGLITGTGALVVYVIVAVNRGLKTKDLTWRRVAALSALLTMALPTVSLAYLLPRLHYIPETNLTLGYDGMRQVAARFAGINVRALKIVLATNATWPLRLATSPGAYAGAIPLLLSFGGLFDKRHRRLTAALLVYAAVLYVVAMKAVVARIAPLVHSLPFADFYPHRPERFRYGVLLAIAVLVGLGVEAWRRADAHRRAVMILPGVVVWVALPLTVGAPPGRMALLAAGAVAGGAALLAAARRPQLLAVVPVVVAFELGAGALWGQSWGSQFVPHGLEQRGANPLAPLLRPHVNAADSIQVSPLDRALRARGVGRELGLGTSLAAKSEAILARLEEAQGYNPTQLRWYWTYVQAVDRRWRGVFAYNKATFIDPSAQVLNLLQVTSAVTRLNRPPGIGGLGRGRRVGRWRLFPVEHPSPRASVLSAWQVVRPARALALVTGARFDPGGRAILQTSPGIRPGPGAASAGRATYRALGTQAAEIGVIARRPSVVLVRNTYDDNWHATVDGRPAPVLRADYLLQAVPVPRGRHTIRLVYNDPWIGYGMLGSALALAGLFGAGILLHQRESGQTPIPPPRSST